MILIIGNSKDLIKPVINSLKKITNKRFIVFRADLCLQNEGAGFSFIDGESNFFVDIGSSEYKLSDVESVWFWKPLLPKELREYEPYEDSVFIYRQFLALWRSMVSFMKEAKWINDYYSMLEAEYKPIQLKKAKEVGFEVPDTLITQNPERAMDFWIHCNREMIVKTLVVGIHPRRVVFTHQVSDYFMSNIERIKTSPVILQRLVEKKIELRITVVENSVFAATVKSQSEIDWRRGLVKASSFELPGKIKQLCIDYVAELGLRFGCIDMILSPDGTYYFLEINPNGQWKFIEERTGLPIGKAIAQALIS